MFESFRIIEVPAAIVAIAVLAAPTQGPSRPHSCRVSAVPYWGSIVADVRWTDASSNEEGFEAEWWLQDPANNSWSRVDTHTVGPNVSETFLRLHSGRNRYRVRAFNGAGTSAWSNWASLTYP